MEQDICSSKKKKNFNSDFDLMETLMFIRPTGSSKSVCLYMWDLGNWVASLNKPTLREISIYSKISKNRNMSWINRLFGQIIKEMHRYSTGLCTRIWGWVSFNNPPRKKPTYCFRRTTYVKFYPTNCGIQLTLSLNIWMLTEANCHAPGCSVWPTHRQYF